MKRFFAIILVMVAIGAHSQIKCGEAIAAADVAFGGGERLNYSIHYSSALLKTAVADIAFTTTAEGERLRITAIGKTRPFYSIFYDMEDTYHCWVDAHTLRPIRTTSQLREAGYRYRSEFNYNWATMEVKTFGENLKSGNRYNYTLPLKDCSMDALALFYNLRSVDISKMETGRRYKLDLVLEDTVRTVNYRLIGREEKKLDGIGTFRTLKVACQIATSSDDSLKDGTEFFIWLSDDKNRIPIYMETPIRVGSIKAYLSSWAGLRHPFSSVVIRNP